MSEYEDIENRDNLGDILSIRLSETEISFWSGDLVEQQLWKSEQMRIISPVGGEEFCWLFNNNVDIEQNIHNAVTDFVERNGEIPSRKIVYIDSPKTVLIPPSLHKEGVGEEYLRFNNLAPSDGEQVDVTTALGDTVAVIASPQRALKALGEHLGEFMIASPLQYNLIRTPQVKFGKDDNNIVMLYLSPERVYIAIIKQQTSGLSAPLFVDSFPRDSHADIVYYLNALDTIFGTLTSPHLIKCADCEEVVSSLVGFFKHTQCG